MWASAIYQLTHQKLPGNTWLSKPCECLKNYQKLLWRKPMILRSQRVTTSHGRVNKFHRMTKIGEHRDSGTFLLATHKMHYVYALLWSTKNLLCILCTGSCLLGSNSEPAEGRRRSHRQRHLCMIFFDRPSTCAARRRWPTECHTERPSWVKLSIIENFVWGHGWRWNPQEPLAVTAYLCHSMHVCGSVPSQLEIKMTMRLVLQSWTQH